MSNCGPLHRSWLTLHLISSTTSTMGIGNVLCTITKASETGKAKGSAGRTEQVTSLSQNGGKPEKNTQEWSSYWEMTSGLLLERKQNVGTASLISFQKRVSSASFVLGSELSTGKRDKWGLAHCLIRQGHRAVARPGCALETDRSSRKLEHREDKVEGDLLRE